MIKPKPSIGIIDYGIGNHTSVSRCIGEIGFRSRISDKISVLDEMDVLMLPGVGAFPEAMQQLHQRGLTTYLKTAAELGRPIIGICLGMQLFADSSTELGITDGLGLIPGSVESIGEPRWHIGWNDLVRPPGRSILHESSSHTMYFNHSYVYHCRDEYVAAWFRFEKEGPLHIAAVQHGSVIGLQFHPEKSQRSGVELLRNTILASMEV